MFLLALLLILLPLNYYLYRKAARFIGAHTGNDPHLTGLARRSSRIFQLRAWFLLINSPLLIIAAVNLSGSSLNITPLGLLKFAVFPFFAWVATLMAFLPVAAFSDFAGLLWRGVDRLTGSNTAPNLARRGFLSTAAACVPPVLFATGLKGVYGPHDLDISPVNTVAIPGLPRHFDGMTITQVSDIHAGAYIRTPEMDRLVAAVNALKGDMIVVTGDFMDNSLLLLDDTRAALSRLRAPMGVYGNLGNHDYYADRAVDGYPGCMAIMGAMQAAGIQMLRNAHLTIGPADRPADQFVLGGVDWTGKRSGNPNAYDSFATRAALAQTFAEAPEGMPRVLLAHHPHVFLDSPDFGASLTLAGHTHGGGQVVIAERDGHAIAVGSAFYIYVNGLYRRGPATLYVNRGIGYVGLPIRLNCPPEVSRFKLIRG